MNTVVAGLAERLEPMCAEAERRLGQEMPDTLSRIDPLLRRQVTEATFTRVLALLSGRREDPAARRLHVRFGSAAAMAGVGFEELMSAYRVGARVGWRTAMDLAASVDLGQDAAMAMAEAHVAYLDQLAADSLEGYSESRRQMVDQAVEAEMRLLRVLLSGEGAGQALSAVSWRPPERVAVAVLLGRLESRDPALLVGSFEGTPVAVGEERALAKLPVAAALGQPGPMARLPGSLAQARRLAQLMAVGGEWGGPQRFDDHLVPLLLHSRPDAASALRRKRLAPLEAMPPRRQHLLRETLAAWVAHPGAPLAMAKAMHLHPQTVRYRLGRLREVFGDELDDPQARLEFALALAAEHTPAAGPTPPGR